MKIHEYQAKEIFKKCGIPVPPGEVAFSADEARDIAARIGKPVMLKAQVHVGGRGKAGGIKPASNPEEAYRVASQILGMNIKGLTVKKVLVTEQKEIVSEAYFGVIVDRASKKPILMASAAGGIDIEEVAAKTPEKIIKVAIDPLLGILPFQARVVAYKVYSEPKIAAQVTNIVRQLYQAFFENGASLAEINPLVVTDNNQVWALDAKIVLDDNDLEKHPDLQKLRDIDEEDKDELEAKEAGLSYVKMEGDIGCVVNGAGLAMATMDLVKYYGGEPANFLDVGGSSSPEKVISALKIILRSAKVKAILFNIFGGITRCDDIANGIVMAVRELKPQVPIVARLVGTNEDKARKILEEVNLMTANSMEEVVKKAIEVSRN
jgi:succinyl-CoA synthetase beta subunit